MNTSLTTANRCYRLKRQCEPSEPIRRRRAPRLHKPAPKIAQLEGRIDNLVTLLRTVGKSPNASAELRSVLEQDASTNAEQPSGTHHESGTGPKLREETISVPALAPATGATPPIEVSPANSCATPSASQSPSVETPVSNAEDGSTASPYLQTETEQEMCLKLFRTGMVPRCPFICIPPDVSAASLKHDRPLFFKAICAVTAPSQKEKDARVNDLKRLIAAQMVVENKSTMELLLALLTFIAWGNEGVHTKTGLSRYMMLAMSVVYDLRLNNPDKHASRFLRKGNANPAAGDNTKHQCEVDERSKDDLLERCRAVLGCFILSQW